MRRLSITNPLRRLTNMPATVKQQFVAGGLGMTPPGNEVEEEGAGIILDDSESVHPVLGGSIVGFGIMGVDDLDGFVLSS